jgi:serine protease Do
VSIRDLTEEDLKGGKSASIGVMIDEVEADSPAQKAGFRTGDVIVEFDGERVRSTRQFTRLVQETPPGRQVQAAVMRDAQRVPLTVQPRDSGSFRFDKWSKLDELRVLPKMVPPDPPKPPRFEMFYGGGRLGITVDDLSSQLGDYFGTKEGVLVTSVNANSVAAKAGLKAGDVITSLNGGAVVTSSDLRRRTQRLEGGDEFTLAIVRDKKPMTLKGKVEDSPTRRPTARTII